MKQKMVLPKMSDEEINNANTAKVPQGPGVKSPFSGLEEPKKPNAPDAPGKDAPGKEAPGMKTKEPPHKKTMPTETPTKTGDMPKKC